jgi:aminoglycoside phosphotransferase (APT) family kinase protein
MLFVAFFTLAATVVLAVSGWAIRAHDDYERALRERGLTDLPTDFAAYQRRYGLAPWRWFRLAPRFAVAQMKLSSYAKDDPFAESLRQRFFRRRRISLATLSGAMVTLYFASRIM